MRRRGNKSHKVPNVKLRPAEKGSFTRPIPIEESCLAQDTQPGSDDTTVYDSCPRPFKGFAICATGIQDKPTLFRQAVELGATCVPAFTDRVTHLVACDHGSAKYNCALERKIPIMKSSWITESYQIWLKGDDVDVPKSVQEHRLPIFSGVIVCPSGIKDLERRSRISQFVKQHDGDYLRSLERPVRVTHLLCSGDEETDKMRYAEKFNARGEANIHLVWEEWFWDSLEFGGRFDEAKYQVRRPRPERKAPSSPPYPPSSELPSQNDEIPSSSAAVTHRQQNAPKPAEHNAGEAEDEQAFVNVLPDVTLRLWDSLLHRRGYEITDGEVILSPSKAKAAAGPNKSKDDSRRKFPESPVKRPQQPLADGKSVLSQFRRANSFAPVVSRKEGAPSRHLPFRRTATTNAVFTANSEAGPSRLPQQQKTVGAIGGDGSTAFPGSLAKQIFAGMKIHALGEAKSPTVRQAVEQHGGTMSTDPDENVDFIIVRLVSGSKLFLQEEDEILRAKYRTECWLEQCIFDERICDPEEHITFRPLSIQVPILDAENLVIAISGFDRAQTFGLKRLFRALGVTHVTTFSRQCTHLLCPSGTGAKFDKAQEWGIPVVSMQYFAALAETGEIPSPSKFLVYGPAPALGELEQQAPAELHSRMLAAGIARQDDMDVDVALELKAGKRDLKGKGKAMDTVDGPAFGLERGKQLAVANAKVMHMMNDITKNVQSELNVTTPHKKRSRAMERQPTVILAADSPEPAGNMMSFGAPNGLLGGIGTKGESTFIHPSSLISPGASARSLPVQGPREQSESFVVWEQDQNNGKSSLQRRQTTVLNIESSSGEGISGAMLEQNQSYRQDRDKRDHIPSSTSPSPMKMPVQRTNSRDSPSPVKIGPEVARALQESIASLLGKRPSPDMEEQGVDGVGPLEGGRNGKRARPQRSKPQSRQPSYTTIGDRPVPAPAPPARRKSSRLATTAYAVASPSAEGGGANLMNPFDAYPDQSLDGKQSLEISSVRVLYEDPAQKEEQNRLISLLKSQEGSQGSSLGRRKSARIAGF